MKKTYTTEQLEQMNNEMLTTIEQVEVFTKECQAIEENFFNFSILALNNLMYDKKDHAEKLVKDVREIARLYLYVEDDEELIETYVYDTYWELLKALSFTEDLIYYYDEQLANIRMMQECYFPSKH